MATPAVPPAPAPPAPERKTPEEKRNLEGASRLALGGWFGLLAGLVTIGIPLLVLEIGVYFPSSFLSLDSGLLQISGTLVLVGSILYILCLFFYRRGFSNLRKISPVFGSATMLCNIGSVGFILLLVAAAVLEGTATSVFGCVHGSPSHALSCLQSGQPLGAYTALVGFAFAWVGGIGIVVGLSLAAGHFGRGSMGLGAIIYLVFLIVLLIPLVEFAIQVPGIQYILILLPILAIAAPVLVLVGARASARAVRAAG